MKFCKANRAHHEIYNREKVGSLPEALYTISYIHRIISNNIRNLLSGKRSSSQDRIKSKLVFPIKPGNFINALANIASQTCQDERGTVTLDFQLDTVSSTLHQPINPSQLPLSSDILPIIASVDLIHFEHRSDSYFSLFRPFSFNFLNVR